MRLVFYKLTHSITPFRFSVIFIDMETLEKIEVYYSLGNENTDYDLVDKNHIRDLIIDRFEKQKSTIEGKYLYSLKLELKITRLNYQMFSMEKLQDISRKLTNGMSSFGGVSYRKLFNDNFLGGVRTISVVDDEFNDYPTFSLNYLVYSHIDNLDIRLLKPLTFRIKMIDPKITFSINYIGKYTPELLSSNIDYRTEVDYNNPVLKKLGEETIDEIFNNQFQRPRFIGGLYKLKP
jgi:hypothetical protein